MKFLGPEKNETLSERHRHRHIARIINIFLPFIPAF